MAGILRKKHQQKAETDARKQARKPDQGNPGRRLPPIRSAPCTREVVSRGDAPLRGRYLSVATTGYLHYP